MILLNKASVLYTFYAPLKASPYFYIGLALVVVGSWLSGFGIFYHYMYWKKNASRQAIAAVRIYGGLHHAALANCDDRRGGRGSRSADPLVVRLDGKKSMSCSAAPCSGISVIRSFIFGCCPPIFAGM